MAAAVIMPALGMAQETGLLVRWLKQAGQSVTKGEPLMEVETDKATVEIEAPESGVLGGVTAQEGETVPVGHTIAWVLAAGETPPAQAETMQEGHAPTAQAVEAVTPSEPTASRPAEISVVARNVAVEHGVDLSQVHPRGKRIEKADVLAYLNEGSMASDANAPALRSDGSKLMPASPKARRLAKEAGLDLATIRGTGPEGAVLTADVLEAQRITQPEAQPEPMQAGPVEHLSTTWRLMAERTTASWIRAPHFYLVREVNAARFVQWREELLPEVEKGTGVKLTFTDLLVKTIAAALKHHPRLTSTWQEGTIRSNSEIHIALAVAVEDGLVAPVIHQADRLSLSELARQRQDLVERAQARQLRPADLEGGTFTLTNLGMYNVDAFNAVINPPQAAILAVGKIAERVIALEGQPVVRPTIILSLSCDHRLVDGARGAQFLDELSNLIDNPWRLIV